MAFGGITVSILGLPKLKANLEKFSQLQEALTKSVLITHTDEQIIPLAQDLAPVDTGDLRKSIRREPAGDEVDESAKLFLVNILAGGVVGEVRGKIIDYAAHVHEEHPTHSKFIQKAVLQKGKELPGAFKRTWNRDMEGKKL